MINGPTLVSLFAASLSFAVPQLLVSQSSPTGCGEQLMSHPIRPGTEADERVRLAQLRGSVAENGYLMRSTVGTVAAKSPSCGVNMEIIAPTVRTVWNSDLPSSYNRGSLWAGRGINAEISAGLSAEYGPAYIVIAPQLEYSRNLKFDQRLPLSSPEHALLPIWQGGRFLIDQPLRPGYVSVRRATAGQSEVGFRTGPVAFGASITDEWWGPGVRNSIVLSNNAPGIPRLFLSSRQPIETPIGSLEFQWIAGELTGSGLLGATLAVPSPADRRALSAAVLALQVPRVSGLTLGIARSVYSPIDDFGEVPGNAFDVFTDWSTTDTMKAAEPARSDQLVSVFGRWIIPQAGAEVYGEWARHELPHSLRDFLVYPHHSRGYTLGMQWSRPLYDLGLFRIQAEATNLEVDPTYHFGKQPSFYVGRSSPAGYTNRGRVIGAAIGPGSSSQWMSVDLFSRSRRIGLYGERIRWNTDAYFSTPSPWAFLGHDVSIRSGVRAGSEISGWAVGAEVGLEHRMNYLFQNWATSWESAARDAVNITNWTLQVSVTPATSIP
jgi:hypothetical protein